MMFPVLILCALIYDVKTARILSYVPTPLFSHQSVFRPLLRELSLRGHQVTVLTTHPMNDVDLTNLTEINLGLASKIPRIPDVIKASRSNAIDGLACFFLEMYEVMDQHLDYAPVKKLIHDNATGFDLVIAEYFYGIPMVFSKRFRCPAIAMLPMDAWNNHYKWTGSPTHPVLFPDALIATDRSPLLARLKSFISSFATNSKLLEASLEREQTLVSKHFGHYPPVRDIFQEISLLLVNVDTIFHPIRPITPNVIQIGSGFHRSSTVQHLPQDLQETLDGATDGFVYFSFGSTVRGESLPPETLQTFSDVFRELPYVVLWKFEGRLPNKPDNVIASKWFPQQAVLGHPNVKLFITQGGLQSRDEAIHARVPMLGIPFLGDQFYNVRRMANLGFGLELDHDGLRKDELKAAILEAIENPKYKETITRLAMLAEDQPMTGLEKAVWWTEYVIRHKGAKHLRGPQLSVPWYQYLLLDVLGVLAVTASLIALFIYVVVKSVIRLLKRQSVVKPKIE
ncbi:UDP-glucuronosyltransferase 1-3-like [Photinus pyralis]|nr:UDP-glucuronosyltransferase 1-3-like [Photinus pyralis]